MSHKPMYKVNEGGFDKVVRKPCNTTHFQVCVVGSFDAHAHSDKLVCIPEGCRNSTAIRRRRLAPNFLE